ncbi:3'(2'),5'-bisphosphate nucleotidase CysQ [Synechococcus sp. PCC 6312]|uniref:3'(2'),5'-bisphosphate nucleotidase CysQ family protein n=1 Tax=Synechococcus sp. (strain ATCC 27167 / PCC 6312) TaxID=195253 RepID=UPI00029F1D12|nr:inositol monophosphatase family protein [Synechococcus sp. PCC 6312]AFY62283.1 3'-phosphoadenosine 5'-phosphosulfate (PAPS) 3'-phosphatase [Synechococcus sp. PCC 6312]
MTPVSLAQLTHINQALRDAGQLAQTLATQPFEIIEKGKNDFATSIDCQLDEQLSQQFQAWFPADGIITEENPDSRIQFHQNYERLWLIDPLDGTDDLIRIQKNYAVMVGLWQEGAPRAGWVYDPAADQLFYGGPSWGLWQSNGNDPAFPLKPSPPPHPTPDQAPLMIGYKDFQAYGAAIQHAIPETQFHFLGSFGLKVLQVITGQVGLYLYLNKRVKLWDTTAPLALAQAAGLICCDLTGEPLRFSADSLEHETLTHDQTILVGWPNYINCFRERLQLAIESV